MSIFRNIRVIPTHGTRSARVSWEVPPDKVGGDVYVAFSYSGTSGSWKALNEDAPVGAGVGFYIDNTLQITAGHQIGYYRLLHVQDGVDTRSEPIGIFTDLERREYGIIHRIIQNEFVSMRASNGYPVYHCIPRTFGEYTDHRDPDTGVIEGIECPDTPEDEASYGELYKGGYFPPVLTWMRAISIRRDTLTDRPDGLGSQEDDVTRARFLAFPKPVRNHLIVDPVTDRRYLVGNEVTPFLYRGIFPIAYEVDLHYLNPADVRYRFKMPEIDMKAYRKIKYWT